MGKEIIEFDASHVQQPRPDIKIAAELPLNNTERVDQHGNPHVQTTDENMNARFTIRLIDDKKRAYISASEVTTRDLKSTVITVKLNGRQIGQFPVEFENKGGRYKKFKCHIKMPKLVPADTLLFHFDVYREDPSSEIEKVSGDIKDKASGAIEEGE